MNRWILIALLGLLCPLAVQAQTPFDRGFAGKNKVFIPKGSMGIGLSASFSKVAFGEGEGYTLIPSHIGELKGDWFNYGAHPSFEYFIQDNWSVGIRFDYVNRGFALDRASLALNDDLDFSIDAWNYLRQSYLGSVITRYYVPFLGSRIFGWFVEGGITGGYIQSKNYTLEDDLKHGTYQDNLKIAVGMNPGICFFVAENFNFEVQVGLIDLSWIQVDQTENQVKKSRIWRFNASEKIDIFAIRFGARMYL